VSKEELLEHLQIQFINRTNEVGVDINRCMNHPYTTNLAQFICGLGKRKAIALMKVWINRSLFFLLHLPDTEMHSYSFVLLYSQTLKHNHQRLENRTQLITVCHMGPKIFINCSGFIKIDTNSLGDRLNLTHPYQQI
jgi:transcription elongation factor SPT6